MSRGAKQLCVLAAVLAVCAGAYLGIRLWVGGEAAEEAAPLALEWTGLTGLTIEREGGTLSFDKGDDGLWHSADQPGFPLDQGALTGMEELLGSLEAEKVIPDPEGDASYGLDQPALRITGERSGAAAGTFLVGNAVNGGYYAKEEGGGTVYTISSALMTAADKDLLGLIDLEDIPTVTEGSVRSVTLTLPGATYALEKTVSTGEDGTETDDWTLNGAALAEDDSALTAAVGALAGLDFTACHAWMPDAETLSACGMDSPARVTVTYSLGDGDGSYTLLLGGADEDGNYYAQMEGSQQLDLLGTSSAQALLGLAEAGKT